MRAAPGRVDSPPTSTMVGAVGGQRQPVFDGAVAVEEQPSVGEGVVGDVDDPHHRAAPVSRASLPQDRDPAPRHRDASSVLNCPRTADVVVRGTGLADAAHRHAQVLGLDDDDHAARIELAHQRVGDLTRSAAPAPAGAWRTGRPAGRSSTGRSPGRPRRGCSRRGPRRGTAPGGARRWSTSGCRLTRTNSSWCSSNVVSSTVSGSVYSPANISV